MSKLLVIVGSTRPNRAADRVMPWLTEKTTGHAAFDTEIVDLRGLAAADLRRAHGHVIPYVANAFDEQGKPVSPVMNVAADVMLDDLAWWSAALEKARAAGELVPGSFRLRAATAAK